MFEAQRRIAWVALWMSHPAWPSFVWQTLRLPIWSPPRLLRRQETSEPLHISGNRSRDVEVVNYSAGKVTGLTAQAEILNLDDPSRGKNRETTDTPKTADYAHRIEYPSSGLTAVHFHPPDLRRGGEDGFPNFIGGLEDGNFRALRDLPQSLTRSLYPGRAGKQRWVLVTRLEQCRQPAGLMVRVKAVTGKSSSHPARSLHAQLHRADAGRKATIRTELEDAIPAANARAS